MPIQVVNNGRNNHIRLGSDLYNKSNGMIVIDGDYNSVEIAPPQAITGDIEIHVSGGASLTIAPNCILGHLFVFAVSEAHLRLGHTTRLNGRVQFLLHEPAAITVGDRCLFGGDVDVTVSDMHSIVSAETGIRVNPAEDIVIGDDVWVGQRATILKGAKIGAGAIIGASAVVTGYVPANCVAAGNPARIVREGVTWREELL